MIILICTAFIPYVLLVDVDTPRGTQKLRSLFLFQLGRGKGLIVKVGQGERA